jgi:hypothetical protein
MTPRAALDHGLGDLNLALPESARQKLIAYLELLAKWNKTFNLTAIRDPLQMVSLHLLDSLSVSRELPPRPSCRRWLRTGTSRDSDRDCRARARDRPPRSEPEERFVLAASGD